MPASNVISERPDPLVGLCFYDFVVERKLAQGGMGAVYLLRHERYPIRKVLKVILAQYADQLAIRERFEREAHAVASLKHPNIAKIDSVGTINGQPCMLIPFLEGQPLDAYLTARGGLLRPHEVLHIATQIARALHHAHGEGVIHRDLKPGNVFVEPTEDDPQAIQVLDFGIAKQLKSSEPSFGTSGPLGTPEYMAVEQFEHASDVTPAADIWALATVIWEMCTGRRPWTAPNAFALYHQQLHEPPEPPAAGALSPAWELMLRQALSPNPRMRPQSMPALVVPLAHALPASPPDEPSGIEVLRRDAPKWLEEVAAGPATARWKLAILGTSAAMLSAVAISTISSLGGDGEAASGIPIAPVRGTSAPEASSTMRSIRPTQSETRPTAPSAPPTPPAAVTPAMPSPSARRAPPNEEQPTVQSSAMQPAELPRTSRTTAPMHPSSPPGRSAGRPTTRTRPPADEGAPGIAEPRTTSGSQAVQARPDPAQRNGNFDPNAVGGREK